VGKRSVAGFVCGGYVFILELVGKLVRLGVWEGLCCSQGLAFCTKVMADLETNATQPLEEQSKAQIQMEKASYKRKAREWLVQQAGAVSSSAPAKKKFRKSSYRLMLACQHMLEACTGQGWQRFIPPASLDTWGPPANWPSITLTIDQGSDGWCMAHFLLYQKKANLLLLCDSSHRVWNDCTNALKKCKVWHLVLLMVICLNLDHGPWKDERWLQQSREASLEYVKIADPDTDSVLQMLLPRIAHETGDSDRLVDPSYAEEVLLSLPGAWREKTEKVAMSRWFGFVDSLQALRPRWSKRLVILLYQGIAQGHLSVSTSQQLIKARVDACHSDIREDTEAARTSMEGKDIKQLRAACKNTLQLATTVLMDFELQCIMVGIVLLLTPLRNWHSEQNKVKRSAMEVCQWYVGQALGKGIASLQLLVCAFSAQGSIAEVGLWSGGRLPPVGSSILDEGHPIVVGQNMVASQLGELTIALLGQRLKSSSWSQSGYPGMLAGLLDAAVAPAILARLQDDWENFQKIKEYSKTSFLKKVSNRSPFNLTFMIKAGLIYHMPAVVALCMHSCPLLTPASQP
jgi:hypothetical protein